MNTTEALQVVKQAEQMPSATEEYTFWCILVYPRSFWRILAHPDHFGAPGLRHS